MNEATVKHDTARPMKFGSSHCRFCQHPLTTTFVDLGMSPLCETHFSRVNSSIKWSPIIRSTCWCAATAFWCNWENTSGRTTSSPNTHIFPLFHVVGRTRASVLRDDCGSARPWIARARFSRLASNDGYLLQHFLPLGIPVIGIEPGVNVADVARRKNIPTLTEFFGWPHIALVAEGRRADLIIGNNVLAHVPDLNDFVGGMAHLSGRQRRDHARIPTSGTADRGKSVRHHLSRALFVLLSGHDRSSGPQARHEVFDVEELPTHGGSLRVICAAPMASASRPRPMSNALLAHERSIGFEDIDVILRGFRAQVHRTKRRCSHS